MLREPIGVLQAALLGIVGLILAFGLALASADTRSRRDAVVAEANAIGTTYLRAQLIAEPRATESLDLLRRYTDSRYASERGAEQRRDAPHDAAQGRHPAAPLAPRRRVDLGRADREAPRLYIDTLNDMIDQETVRLSRAQQPRPRAVLGLEVIGAAVVVGLSRSISRCSAEDSRGDAAAGLVTLLLLVTFDLDRPTQG